MSKRMSIVTVGLLSAAAAAVARGQEYDITSDTFIDSGSPGTINPSTGMENDPGSVVNGQDIYSYGADGKVKAVSSNFSSSYPYISYTHVLFNLPESFWSELSSEPVAAASVSYYAFNDSLDPGDGHGLMQIDPMTRAFTIGNGTQSPLVASTDGGATWDTYDGSESDLWTTPGGDYDSSNFVLDENGNNFPVSKGSAPFTWNITSLIVNPTTSAEMENYGTIIKVYNETILPSDANDGGENVDDFVSFYSANYETAMGTTNPEYLPNVQVTLYTAMTSTSGGSWSNSGNWNGAIPNGVGAAALLSNAAAPGTTVTLDGGYTVGVLGFSGGNSYILAPGNGGSLTFDDGGIYTTANLNDVSGSHTISAPVILNSTLAVTVANSGDTVSISGNVSGVGGVAMSGNGTLALSGVNTYGGSTVVNGGAFVISNASALPSETGVSVYGGTLKLAGGGSAFTLSSLTVSTGATLDLGGNAVILDYSNAPSDPISTIVSYLTDGYNGGWASGEITSSSVASLNGSQKGLDYSIGYADGADGITTAVPSGEIDVMATIAGDAKLQGNVVFGDFQVLAQYFGQSGGWDQGDFTYSGVVTFGDFQLLAQDFGANTNVLLTGAEMASLNNFAAEFGDRLTANADGVGFQIVAVPEPATIALLTAGTGLLLTRRRRAR
ncbi:MAG TPA: PEP-CTERM sorting domain-containing protein [Tepidisphaeraceae bacterium]|nr:PEP-CTERM sorting domain-containing protein [Tepidisphaeraceae bacterium]